MKINKFFAMLLSLACATSFVACDSDDVVKIPLSEPTLSNSFKNYESLSFEWNAVDNCLQYGYQLLTSEGAVVNAGVVSEPGVTFNYLEPDTEYTLNVWAFAGLDTDYSTPPAVTITARTDALIVLASPVLSVEDPDAMVMIVWDAVPDAEEYSYIVKDSEGATLSSGTLTETSFMGAQFGPGEYSISVTALTSVGGYAASLPATIDFTVHEVTELWRVVGTYISGYLDQDWEATLIAYSDRSFTIPAFFGKEGYDLSFKLSLDGEFEFTVGEEYTNPMTGWIYWRIPTGVKGNNYLWAYPWDNWCNYSYDESTGEGQIYIGNYGATSSGGTEWYEDYFVWFN